MAFFIGLYDCESSLELRGIKRFFRSDEVPHLLCSFSIFDKGAAVEAGIMQHVNVVPQGRAGFQSKDLRPLLEQNDFLCGGGPI